MSAGGINVKCPAGAAAARPVLTSAFPAASLLLLRCREVSLSLKVSHAESGGRYDLGLSGPSLELAL